VRTILLSLVAAALLHGCGGGSSGGGRKKKPPPAASLTVEYPTAAPSFRIGVAVSGFTAKITGGNATGFSIAPALPTGIALDPATGAIAGTPTAAARTARFVVTATGPDGDAQAGLDLSVTPALPGDLISLADGFAAERITTGLTAPVKLAFAPDGRLFVNELTTGNIRVIRADGSLVAAPVATVTIVAGAERGLLGLALSPEFAVSGHLFVFASVPVGGGKPDRNQVIRFTVVGDAGTNPTVILDDLPHAAIHNAGDLQFGSDGKLYVSVGDSGDGALPQADGSLAGRILRVNADGTVPGDNPDPASPEWCRGLRNSFDLAFHPTAGGLFATENGPTFGDEVNFIQRDRNYEWKDLPAGFPGARIGLRIIEWTPVIAPTGLVFQSGRSFGSEYANNLFVLGYVDADIRRLVMSGAAFTDLDDEIPFAAFEDSGVSNKPLDAVEAPDGSLWVSTFGGIWRFERW